jgi:hypothetical protein
LGHIIVSISSANGCQLSATTKTRLLKASFLAAVREPLIVASRLSTEFILWALSRTGLRGVKLYPIAGPFAVAEPPTEADPRVEYFTVIATTHARDRCSRRAVKNCPGDICRTDDGAVIQVRGKGDKNRRIPLKPALI